MNALMDVGSAAHALGGQVIGRGAIVCPGPGHSHHDRSLSVRFDSGAPEGFTVNSFAGDDFALCRDHVKAALGIVFEGARQEPRNVWVRPTPIQAPVRSASALEIWRASTAIVGTLAADYLASRGMSADAIENAGSLRFHPRCPFDGGKVPAMVAAMVNVRTNEMQGVHRTRVDQKHKMMLGPAKGAVVKLSRDAEVTTGLHICEGIETGLALISRGLAPVWACLTAGGIASLPVLSGIEALTIYADNDENGTGQEAARQCARRWKASGCDVRALTTPTAGTDFADWNE